MEKIYESEKVCLHYDTLNNTVHIEWIGIVELEDFRNGIEQVLAQTSHLLSVNVIVNYKRMTDITAEARLWYVNCFLSDAGFDLLHKVSKLAVIKSSGTIQRRIIDRFKNLYYGVFPDLNYHQFVVPHFAIQWIVSNTIPEKRNKRTFQPLIERALKLRFS